MRSEQIPKKNNVVDQDATNEVTVFWEDPSNKQGEKVYISTPNVLVTNTKELPANLYIKQNQVKSSN